MIPAPQSARPVHVGVLLAALLTTSVAGCSMFASPHQTAENALRAGNYAAAIEAYSEAIADGDYPAVAYANRCYAYQAKGDYDVAVHDCTEALDLLGEPDPDAEDEASVAALKEYTEVLNNRAVANIGMRRYDEAIEDLDRAIDLRDDYAEAYANRGRVFVEQEEYEKAIADLERAVELSPRLAEAFGNWAQALTGLGDADTALEKFGTAIEVSGGSPDIHFNRASLLYAIGRFEEALADYRVCAEKSQNGQLQWMCEQQVIFLSGLDTPTPGGPERVTRTPSAPEDVTRTRSTPEDGATPSPSGTSASSGTAATRSTSGTRSAASATRSDASATGSPEVSGSGSIQRPPAASATAQGTPTSAERP